MIRHTVRCRQPSHSAATTAPHTRQGVETKTHSRGRRSGHSLRSLLLTGCERRFRAILLKPSTGAVWRLQVLLLPLMQPPLERRQSDGDEADVEFGESRHEHPCFQPAAAVVEKDVAEPAVGGDGHLYCVADAVGGKDHDAETEEHRDREPLPLAERRDVAAHDEEADEDEGEMSCEMEDGGDGGGGEEVEARLSHAAAFRYGPGVEMLVDMKWNI